MVLEDFETFANSCRKGYEIELHLEDGEIIQGKFLDAVVTSSGDGKLEFRCAPNSDGLDILCTANVPIVDNHYEGRKIEAYKFSAGSFDCLE